MPRLAALLILLLLVAMAGGVWLWSQDQNADDVPTTITQSEVGARTAETAILDAPVETGEEPAPLRDIVLEEGEAKKPKILAIERAPEDAVWIAGRVVYPLDAPAEENLKVLARGRRFADRERGPQAGVHSALVREDGTFRVAVAKGTKRAWLTLEARYLYMDPRLKVELKGLEGEVLLEPALGGALSVQLQPADSIEPTDALWEEIVLTVTASNRGANAPQLLRHEGAGKYVIGGLRPADRYRLKLSSKVFVEESLLDVAIRPAEVTERVLSLEEGARISGQVVDTNGLGVAEVNVRFEVQRRVTNESWFESEGVTADEEGRFEMTGAALQGVTLTVTKEGFLETKMELDDMLPGTVHDGLLIELAAGLGISGIVQWPDGVPVDGATIVVEQENGEWFGMGADITTRSAEDGTFAVFGLIEGSACTVKASARQDSAHGGAGPKTKRPRWRAEQREVEPGTQAMVFVLQPGGSLSGRVVDDTGEPLERFRVRATPRDGEYFSFMSDKQVTQTYRDENGLFELAGLVEGEWDVYASSTGHGHAEPVEVSMPYSGGDLVVVVPRAATISGEVRGPAGTPVAGATVKYKISSDSRGIFRYGLRDAEKVTDAEGRFEFDSVTPGKATLAARSVEFGSSSETELELVPAQELTGVVLTMRAPARLTGEIDPAASPVAGRTITVDQIDGRHNGRAQTDEKGHFEFPSLSPGEYMVVLWPPEGELEIDADWSVINAQQISERVTLVEGGEAHVILGAPPENAIRVFGTVKSGGQAVPAGTPLSAQRWDDGVESKFTTRTEAGGQYSLLVGGPGSYTWTIGRESSSLVRIRREVPEGENTRIDFELPTGSLAGVVRRPGGGVLADHEISIVREFSGADDPHGDLWRNRTAETDAEGRYSFTNLIGGNYVVRAGGSKTWFWASGKAPYGRKVEALAMEDGEHRVLDFDLERAGVVEGSVMQGGVAVEGAGVYIKDSRGNDLSVWTSCQTDENGKFTYRGVNPGTVTIHADHDDSRSEETEVRVYENQTARINLTLPD